MRHILFLAGLCILCAGCGSVSVDGVWRDRQVVVDGQNDEWQDIKTYVMNKKVAVSVMNDSEYLYFHLVCWDRDMFSVMREGFTLWFSQGKEKTGVRYPAGPNRMALLDMKGTDSLNEPAGFFEDKGFAASAGEYKNNWVYELKVPLIKNDKYPYSLQLDWKKPVNILIEASDFIIPLQELSHMPRPEKPVQEKQRPLSLENAIPAGPEGNKSGSSEEMGSFPGFNSYTPGPKKFRLLVKSYLVQEQ